MIGWTLQLCANSLNYLWLEEVLYSIKQYYTQNSDDQETPPPSTPPNEIEENQRIPDYSIPFLENKSTSSEDLKLKSTFSSVESLMYGRKRDFDSQESIIKADIVPKLLSESAPILIVNPFSNQTKYANQDNSESYFTTNNQEEMKEILHNRQASNPVLQLDIITPPQDNTNQEGEEEQAYSTPSISSHDSDRVYFVTDEGFSVWRNTKTGKTTFE